MLTVQEYVEEFLKLDDQSTAHQGSQWSDPQLQWGFDNSRHFTHDEFILAIGLINKKRRSATQKTYQYLVTFTLDPTKHPTVTQALEDKIQAYIESQADRPALQVTSLTYVRELHKSGRPHWHAKFLTTKAIRTDAFTQYNKIYGKTDISRSKHTNGQHIDLYINKENTAKSVK